MIKQPIRATFWRRPSDANPDRMCLFSNRNKERSGGLRGFTDLLERLSNLVAALPPKRIACRVVRGGGGRACPTYTDGRKESTTLPVYGLRTAVHWHGTVNVADARRWMVKVQMQV
jgi:hypothetical protein